MLPENSLFLIRKQFKLAAVQMLPKHAKLEHVTVWGGSLSKWLLNMKRQFKMNYTAVTRRRRAAAAE